MPTPNCWKAKSTDASAFAGTPGTRGGSVAGFCCAPSRPVRADGACAPKSSRSFRANALVRREIRAPSSNDCTTASRAARTRRRCRARSRDASRSREEGMLQAAPLLARRRCVARMRASPTRMRCVDARRDRRVARGRRRSAAEKLRERLLTPEKSVIRFRPADIPCGSK